MTITMVGGGGHCRACLDVVAETGTTIHGIMDPKPVPADMGKWLGDSSWLDNAEARNTTYLITVGQVDISPVRRELFEKVQERGLPFATVISGHAVVSRHSQIGAGSIVMHRAVINRGASVGRNCIINTGAIIEHDAQVADHCHISTGAIVNGGVQIGEGCMIGSGAILLHGVKIAPNVLVGAGAVVTRNIETAGTWLGVPARTAP